MKREEHSQFIQWLYNCIVFTLSSEARLNALGSDKISGEMLSYNTQHHIHNLG